MTVRNFWIEADIDGRQTRLRGGPQSKDGGFSLTVYMRDEGSIHRTVSLEGFALEDGRLRVNVTTRGAELTDTFQNLEGEQIHVSSRTTQRG